MFSQSECVTLKAKIVKLKKKKNWMWDLLKPNSKPIIF